MPEFQINWQLPTFADEEGYQLIENKLNTEWTIVCGVFWGYPYGDRPQLQVQDLQIRRKNTDGDSLVLGELTFEKNGIKIFGRKINYSIKSGISRRYFNIGIPRHMTKITGYLIISSSKSKIEVESKEYIAEKSLEVLSKDLKWLLDPESSCISDVKLNCDGTCVPAHKVILCARSPVFAAMFAHPMKESYKNEVDITDIKVSTMQALLMHTYTGKIPNMTFSLAADLLFAADKYQLQDLKAVCTHFLQGTVSPQTVWKILELGNLHSEDLVSVAVDYIHSEFCVLGKTQEWETLRKEKPSFAMDILETIVNHKNGQIKKQKTR